MIRVYLDTNVFIAAFESTGDRSDDAWAVLDSATTGDIQTVTSELTLAELLPQPNRTRATDLVATYEELITAAGIFAVPSISRSVLRRSAEIRAARPSIKLPDAIHIATALDEQCTCFLSSDLPMPIPESLRSVRLGPRSSNEIRSATA